MTTLYPVPRYVSDAMYVALERLADTIEPEEASPSYGYGFDSFLPDLAVSPYDYAFEPDEPGDLPAPNLVFGDVRLWWYKVAGRGTETDRQLSDADWGAWLRSLDAYVVAEQGDAYDREV